LLEAALVVLREDPAAKPSEEKVADQVDETLNSWPSAHQSVSYVQQSG
jgi:hypothetical protein